MSSSKKALVKYWRTKDMITDEKFLTAFEKVKREKFVLPKHADDAYLDEPLPIGFGQTISQPTTVALMTQALDVREGHKILEVGTGSGYQAAILSKMVGKKGKIFSVERITDLIKFAKKNLKDYKNVSVVHFDGTKGYSKAAPYNRIIVTATAARLPQVIFKQLKENGVMVIPIEDHLFRITKIDGKPKYEDLGLFVFVPLIRGTV